MMNDEERQAQRALLLDSLQGSLRLLEQSTEDGAMFLLDAFVRGLTKMYSDGLLNIAEVKDLTLLLKKVLTDAHPHLAAQLAAGRPLRNAELDELLANPEQHSESELVERIRAVLAQFRERGLRKPH